MGDYSCSESELDSAIEMASFSDVANYKNNGLCARINSRGGGISGGERQRLSLARVLLRRPKVLILDEVTSSVDVKTENEIFETLYALRGSSTVILVSHRLKFLNKADKIFVVDAGEVCEYGTYDQLFAQRGKFYNMVHEFK
jgi:ABC-type multidrug transport system fused ATPase/permease subunit